MKKILLFLICSYVVICQDNSSNAVFTGTFGSATINDKVYNQFSIRPEFSVGRLGVGLDLYFYFDEDGNLYDRNWDFSSGSETYKTIIDKIYYIRWGLPYDEKYFRIGSLPSVTLGFGSLVKGYSNVMDYPRTRRTGFNLKFNMVKYGLEFIHSDLKELSSPGVIGINNSFEFIDNLNLSFTIVTDQNQYNGLLDTDDDGYPDYIEPEYADNPNQWYQYQEISPLLQSLFDNLDCQTIIDGDSNSDDNYHNCLDLHDKLHAGDNTFNIDDVEDNVSGIALGLGYSITDHLTVFTEFSQLLGETINPYCVDSDGDEECDTPDDLDLLSFDDKLGSGYVPFGIKGDWNKVSISIDYRQSSQNFLFNYWDQNYDNNRIILTSNNTLLTKESQLFNYGESSGLQFSLSSSLFKYLNFGMTYQHLKCEKWNGSDYETDDNNTFYTKLDIETSKLRRVRVAEIFYQQSNSTKVFDFKPDENTLFGYNVGLEMADNMVFILKGRKTYIQKENGNYEPVKTTQVETQIIF